VTEVSAQDARAEDSLRRQSELSGQRLRNLPKSWTEKGPPPEAPGFGK